MADSSILGKYHCMLRLGAYERPKPMAPAEIKTITHVKLPLPLELRDDTAVNYSNMDLNAVGDIVNMTIGTGVAAYGLRKSGDVITGGGAALGGALAGAAFGAAGMQQAGDVAQSGVSNAIAEAFPPDQVASAVQQALGVAPNPNPSVMFNGPSLREFNFSWTFFPRNFEEAQNIKATIAKLKKCALPTIAFKESASVLNYPYVVQMNFYPWDAGGKAPYGWSNNSIIKMKKCMMSAVNVNYAPSNVPAFFGSKDSYPVAISLSIQLKEIEYMMSHDWGGSDKGNFSLEDIKNKITEKAKNLADSSTQLTNPPADSEEAQGEQ